MKVIKYFFVGGTAAMVDFLLFAIGVKVFNFPWFPVSFFGFIVATAVNYILSIRHVFTSGVRFNIYHEIILTFLASAVGLAINQTGLYLMIELFKIDSLLVAKLVATGVVFLWNYSVRHYYIFGEIR